jgi:hypothetical protein
MLCAKKGLKSRNPDKEHPNGRKTNRIQIFRVEISRNFVESEEKSRNPKKNGKISG